MALSLVPSAGSLLHDCSWRMRSCVPNLTCTCKQKPLHNTNTVHACPASQYVHPSSPRAPQSVAAWRLFESCQMYRENHIEFPLEFGICIIYIFTYVLDYIYIQLYIYTYIYMGAMLNTFLKSCQNHCLLQTLLVSRLISSSFSGTEEWSLLILVHCVDRMALGGHTIFKLKPT